MEERQNYKYKIFLILLKIIPVVLAGLYFINTILGCFKISLTVINILAGVSVFPLMFLYLSSYVFKFCGYHRMFLHYILLINIYNYLDYIFVFNIESINLFITLMIITFIFMIITLYKYLKDKKGGIYGNNT